MDSSVFNEYDVMVVLIILTSSILSLIRGFIREIFSLFAWIGAGIVTFLYFSKVASWLTPYFSNRMVVSAAAILSIYLVTLITISIVNALILDFSKEVRLGAIDRTLGLAFGFARGLIIASILHFAIILVQGDNEPKWLTEAKTYNLTGFGAGLLKDLTHDYINDIHPADDADSLSDKLSPTFMDSLRAELGHTSPEQKEVFRKVMKGLPKKDRERLAKKLETSESDISEVTLEALVLYQKAAQANLIKKENKLKDEEIPLLEESIKGLQKKVLDTGASGVKDTDIDLPKTGK